MGIIDLPCRLPQFPALIAVAIILVRIFLLIGMVHEYAQVDVSCLSQQHVVRFAHLRGKLILAIWLIPCTSVGLALVWSIAALNMIADTCGISCLAVFSVMFLINMTTSLHGFVVGTQS